MDDVLSLDTCKIFTWELQIIERIEKEYTAFMFGVVQHPIDESIGAWTGDCFGGAVKTKSKQFGVFVHSHYNFFKSYGGSESCYNGHLIGSELTQVSSDHEWKEGDIFRIVIDFEQKEMSLIYNDGDIATVFENIPNEIVPAICLYAPIELKCSKYELL